MLYSLNPLHSPAEPADWFGDWFDSPYYHRLYRHRNEEEARHFLDRLRHHLQLRPDQAVMDLACGKGRHARYLRSLGFQVTGLDLSQASIAHASRFAAPGLSFRVHDMREPFGEERYEVVLNLFTSFGYFTEECQNRAVLQNIARSLQKGGRVVIDYLNPIHALDHLEPYEIKQDQDLRFEIRRDVQRGFIRKLITVTDQERTFHFMEKVKLLYPADFAMFFQQAGLTLTSTYGSYDLAPFEPRTSGRMILVGER